MSERSGGMRETLIVLALVAVLGIQLYYVLHRSPQAQSPSPGATGFLVNEPSPGVLVIDTTPVPVIPTGTIRLGTPTATPDAAETPGAATDPGEPSAGAPDEPTPVQPSTPNPVTPSQPAPVNPGPDGKDPTGTPTAKPATPTPGPTAADRPADPYRRTLLAIYYMEQSPEHALSRSQARQLLAFVNEMEGLRKVVPSAQKELDSVLTVAQKKWMREKAGKLEGGQKAFAPEMTGPYARKILAGLGGR